MAIRLIIVSFLLMLTATTSQFFNYVGENYAAGKSGGRATLYDMATTPSSNYFDEQARQHDIDIAISNGNYRRADENARNRASGDGLSQAVWSAVGAYNQARNMPGYY